jgi:hypothetical protein
MGDPVLVAQFQFIIIYSPLSCTQCNLLIGLTIPMTTRTLHSKIEALRWTEFPAKETRPLRDQHLRNLYFIQGQDSNRNVVQRKKSKRQKQEKDKDNILP